MSKVFTMAIVIVLLSIAAANSSAQTTNASLGGTVSDGTGALIPGVTVSARNIGTGIVNESITNEAGAYQFPNLQNGTYEVSAELVGFRTQRFANVALGVSQQVRLNFRLEVGDVATTVDVTAAADTTLATTSASIGTVLPDLAVRELPSGRPQRSGIALRYGRHRPDGRHTGRLLCGRPAQRDQPHARRPCRFRRPIQPGRAGRDLYESGPR